MDIVGPLIKTAEGYEYILAIVDSQSRWVEAWPLRTQSATEIARILHDEVFCRFGACLEIITDRGRNFMSKLLNALCEIYQVTRHSTSSNHPASNRTAEKQNGNIIQTIRTYVDRSQTNWHTILPVALMALRNSPNVETSGYSPFKMLYGCEMRLPFDAELIPRENWGPEAKEHMQQLLVRLKIYRELAADRSAETKDRDKMRHDLKAKPSDFQIGEQVLLKLNKVPTK